MTYSKQTLDVQGSPMEVLIFEPADAGPHPAMMVAQYTSWWRLCGTAT